MQSEPATDLLNSGAKTIFIAAFDAERLAEHIAHLVPENAEVVTLDEARLDDEMISAPRRYLEPINFRNELCFFRDSGGHHTRVVTANYWAGLGRKMFGFGAVCSVPKAKFLSNGAKNLLLALGPLSSTVRTFVRVSALMLSKDNSSSMPLTLLGMTL